MSQERQNRTNYREISDISCWQALSWLLEGFEADEQKGMRKKRRKRRMRKKDDKGSVFWALRGQGHGATGCCVVLLSSQQESHVEAVTTCLSDDLLFPFVPERGGARAG